MLDNASTKATVAKIHSMYGKMLTQSNYRELLNKQSVSEIAAYLKKNTRYRDILSNIDTNTIHRGLFEILIKRCNFDTYVRLCKFQHLGTISFYNYEIVRQEIEQILSCMQHLNAKNSEEYIETLPGYLISHCSFDMIALAKSKTFDDILKVLKSTPYYKLLKDIKPDESGQIDYLKCEVILRTQYYKNLLEMIEEKFRGREASTLLGDVKSQIDLINIINAYRLKAYYNSEVGFIKKNMLPFYGKINQLQMFKIYEAKDKEQMLELFQKSIYARRLNGIDPEVVENNVYKIRLNYAKSALRSAQSASVALYSFMYLCEVEAINLISIVEGIRYKASPAYIEKLLII